MKKKLFNLMAITAMLFFAFSDLVFAEQAKVVVKSASGTVLIASEDKMIPLEVGAELSPNDVVETGDDGVVDIAWKGKWGYRLAGNSTCVVREIEKDDAVIEMVDGDIIANIRKLPKNSRFRVSTPVAVAAVRGTQFWGQVRPQGDSSKVTFAVREGNVDITVKETGVTHALSEGEALDIQTGITKTDVRSAKDGEMKAMEQADDIKV